MINSTDFARKARLLAATAPFAIVLGGAPAFAQETSTPPTPPSSVDSPLDNRGSAPGEDAQAGDIVVTGSLLRQTDRETPSPVTVLTQDNLDRRGISTVQEGLQTLSSNNGPALVNSFSANGAFAGGASAISLRGLSTNSTLVLFDGQRAAYYPLADDGTRNFVDLNTVPDDVVERIEILRDGASSSYGADAIAGVVNIITKKQFKGFGGRAEGGISEKGDAAQYRLSLTAGVGDLSENGYNAYLSGFYYRSELLRNSDRGYPYNSDDLRSVCYQGVCGPNNVLNGLQADGYTGGYSQSSAFAVRPRDPATGGGVPGQSIRYQLLNGCQGLPSYNPTADELALPQNAAAGDTVCQEDVTNLYGIIQPKIERFGGTARVTATVGNIGEGYAMFNFLQTNVSYTGLPATIRANAPAGFYYPRYSTSANLAVYGNANTLQLPVYICASGVDCDTAADRQLNPNNPYAAQGFNAGINGRIPNLIERNETRTRAYRGALGLKGEVVDGLNYDFAATAMHIDLQTTTNGYVRIQNLLDAIATGSYNFVDPFANSQATLDRLAPENRNTSTSDLYAAQLAFSKDVVQLPGGPLQILAGGAYRYEAVDSPSANSDINGPTQRYFRLNAFATEGHRSVWSAFSEINAPIVDQLTVNLSGRYDHYSTGADNFSPKAGVKFRPIRQVLLRGTYSRGFRIPSFGETNATFPSTGYVPTPAGVYPDSYLAQFGCSQATFDACPAYISTATYGQTSLANNNLKPEKSRSWTAGILLEPIRNVSFTVDYYNIKKTRAITTATYDTALAAYYSGRPIPAGFDVIPDAEDPNTPGALPRVAFVQAPFINANSIKSEGIDFGINASYDVTDTVRLSSFLEASYILELSTTFPDGTKQRYDGTIGNYNLTAGSGTPKWKGTWLNSLTFGSFTLNGTVNYFDGYDLSAEDQTGPGTRKTCSLLAVGQRYVPCKVSDYITGDIGFSVEVNEQFTFYATALNFTDEKPPLDPLTYGAHLYNPVQGGTGILGRYFKAGIKVGF